MLKKIALVMLLALPMGVFAQNLKFGHINAQEIITVMPEFTKAQNDIQTLEKQLTAELQRTQEEFNKKYQEFQPVKMYWNSQSNTSIFFRPFNEPHICIIFTWSTRQYNLISP